MVVSDVQLQGGPDLGFRFFVPDNVDVAVFDRQEVDGDGDRA